MAIVSISKIQHRYGRGENLPQLSAAEFGWAIDDRRLYIGNGPVSEGAPLVGNTEVLTQYSDILNFADSYIYKGAAAGYTHITGDSANTPVARTLQDKIDETISVKDFGAIGDGVTDDTVAINRAFRELFTRETNEEIRRCLLFPAGVYITSDTIKIPPYAKVIGEGKESSIIRRASGNGPTATLADSLLQTDANLGLNSALMPRFIEVYAMSFHNSSAGDVFEITSAINSRFEAVRFQGPEASAPTSVGGARAAMRILSTAVNQSRSIVFEQCDFRRNVFGVVADDDMQNILFNGCEFTTLLKGVKVGEGTTGIGASVNGPRGFRVTNSLFDQIYSVGFHSYQIEDVVSAFNIYREVANSLNGDGNPLTNVVIFEGDNCASVFDMFDRSDADDATFSRIAYGELDVYALSGANVAHGKSRSLPGGTVDLLDNTIGGSTGIIFDNTVSPTAIVRYQVTRGTDIKAGTLAIAGNATNDNIGDTSIEAGATGVTFALDVSGTTTTLQYTTTSTGSDAVMTYQVETFIV